MDETPELAEAAKKTLERRLEHGGGHTGWSRAWILNHYAKLWDGEQAYQNLIQLFAKSTYPNLFDKAEVPLRPCYWTMETVGRQQVLLRC